MNVIHMSRTTLAGVANRYAEFFNKYSDIKARSAMAIPTNIKFPTDIVVPFKYHPGFPLASNRAIILESEEFLEEIKKADIIHMHNAPPINPKSEMWNIIKNKYVVLQLHSPPNISNHAYNLVSKKAQINKLLVIAQYQYRELKPKYPEITPVRNIIDINHELLLPIIKENNPPIISYAPSNQIINKKRAGWGYKSFKEVDPLLRRLDQEHICKYVFQSLPFEQSLKIRHSANIHIDEVSTGSYHLSSLEGLSQGSVVIASIAPWMKDIIKEVTGCDSIPWVCASESNLEKMIMNLLKDKDNLLERQRKSREWMEKYWSPENVLNDYVEVYKCF